MNDVNREDAVKAVISEGQRISRSQMKARLARGHQSALKWDASATDLASGLGWVMSVLPPTRPNFCVLRIFSVYPATHCFIALEMPTERWAMLKQTDRFQHSADSVHCARCNQLHRICADSPRLDRNDIVRAHRGTSQHRIRLRRLDQTL
ncbi:MAG: hypothetical protein KGI34_15250 [Bradyrhizobium sp.]|nr:hypothetical protein [Bradyrhizobium sp.]